MDLPATTKPSANTTIQSTTRTTSVQGPLTTTTVRNTPSTTTVRSSSSTRSVKSTSSTQSTTTVPSISRTTSAQRTSSSTTVPSTSSTTSVRSTSSTTTFTSSTTQNFSFNTTAQNFSSTTIVPTPSNTSTVQDPTKTTKAQDVSSTTTAKNFSNTTATQNVSSTATVQSSTTTATLQTSSSTAERTSSSTTVQRPIITTTLHPAPPVTAKTFPHSTTLSHVLSNSTLQSTQGDSGGIPFAIIAAGVGLPLVCIVVIGVIVYCCYRKKRPVRMIPGRKFAKFTNPAYNRRGSHPHTLVREDAEAFFQQTQPSGPITLNLGGPDEEASVGYINTAFQYDTHDVDEEEVERRFRQQKSYLFRNHDDDSDTETNTNVRKPKKEKSKVNGQARKDQGLDNPAYSGDNADGEDATEDNVDSNENKIDRGSTSSDASTASKKAANEETSVENNDLEAIPDTLPLMLSDSNQQDRASLTVRDFLQMVKEKRAMSDVQRARADSVVTTFEFDITKSARRRAQSVGDIWTSNVQFSSPLTKEDLMLNRRFSTPGEDSATPAEDLNVGQENEEKVTAEVRKSSEDLTDLHLTEPDVKTEEGERLVSDSSYFAFEETQKDDSHEVVPINEEVDIDSDKNGTDSSISDSSFEKIASMQESDLQFIAYDSDNSSVKIQADENSSLAQNRESSMVESFTENQENDFVTVGSLHILPSPLADENELESVAVTESNSSASQLAEYHNDKMCVSSEMTQDMDQIHTANESEETSKSPSASDAGSSPSTNSIRMSFDTLEDLGGIQCSESGLDKTGEMSLSSSLVIVDKTDVEDYDKHEDPDLQTSQHTPPSVQTLSSLAYSDHSSVSSNDSDKPKQEEFVADTAPQHDTLPAAVIPSQTGQSSSDEEGEPTAARQMTTTEFHLPSDSERSLGLAGQSETDMTEKTSDKETNQSPEPSSQETGAVLTIHQRSEPSDHRCEAIMYPDTKSDSDSEGVELTDEDIQEILEDRKGDSSEGHTPLQIEQVPQARKKIQPLEKFVFDDDDIDEDIDV